MARAPAPAEGSAAPRLSTGRDFYSDGSLGRTATPATCMASLWGAPVLLVLKNNFVAQSTPNDSARTQIQTETDEETRVAFGRVAAAPPASAESSVTLKEQG